MHSTHTLNLETYKKVAQFCIRLEMHIPSNKIAHKNVFSYQLARQGFPFEAYPVLGDPVMVNLKIKQDWY